MKISSWDFVQGINSWLLCGTASAKSIPHPLIGEHWHPRLGSNPRPHEPCILTAAPRCPASHLIPNLMLNCTFRIFNSETFYHLLGAPLIIPSHLRQIPRMTPRLTPEKVNARRRFLAIQARSWSFRACRVPGFILRWPTGALPARKERNILTFLALCQWNFRDRRPDLGPHSLNGFFPMFCSLYKHSSTIKLYFSYQFSVDDVKRVKQHVNRW